MHYGTCARSYGFETLTRGNKEQGFPIIVSLRLVSSRLEMSEFLEKDVIFGRHPSRYQNKPWQALSSSTSIPRGPSLLRTICSRWVHMTIVCSTNPYQAGTRAVLLYVLLIKGEGKGKGEGDCTDNNNNNNNGKKKKENCSQSKSDSSSSSCLRRRAISRE